ncbi:MAG: glycerate kinase [Gemmatimonadaceae bacterium]
MAVSPSPALLRSLFDAAVAGAQPRAATERAVGRLGLGPEPVWVVALGKAAPSMAAGAVAALAALGREPTGGIVVGAGAAASPHPALAVAVGDHPMPGPRSLAASAALAGVLSRVEGNDSVLVLLSGGTSSLVGAPVPGVDPEDLARLNALLLASGADITLVNGVRKRVLRWGAGRLALAVTPARLVSLAASDVIGDDQATIGSGPCVPDPTTAAGVLAALRRVGLGAERLPSTVRTYLEAVERGALPETPKPGDRAFERGSAAVIVRNADAVRAAAGAARAHGLRVVRARAALCGEARERGLEIARRVAAGALDGGASGSCYIWGGETTVTLGGAAPDALGGRSQELALAAAGALHELGARARGVTLLAAGTDGRDGPTDAAGAVVDATTWDSVRRAGRDPARDLAAHDAYHALDAAGALLRTGSTGTNVMDVVIGVVRAEDSRAE